MINKMFSNLSPTRPGSMLETRLIASPTSAPTFPSGLCHKTQDAADFGIEVFSLYPCKVDLKAWIVERWLIAQDYKILRR